jgi:glycerol-3-phosphate acyltransferase PlsY
VTETWVGLVWTAGGYLVGTIPSTYLVTRARGGTEVIRRARRQAGETDAHILMTAHLGGRWSALAATADVVKALGYMLLARGVGGLPPPWLALTGVALLVGYGWPPYARAMAGRGLAVASGVYLALLPVEMVVMGVLILLGAVGLGDTALMSTTGLLSVPVVAAVRGETAAYVAMASAILLIVLIRRLEGVGEVIRGGVPAPRALWYRAVHDASGSPRDRAVPGEPGQVPPEAGR